MTFVGKKQIFHINSESLHLVVLSPRKPQHLQQPSWVYPPGGVKTPASLLFDESKYSEILAFVSFCRGWSFLWSLFSTCITSARIQEQFFFFCLYPLWRQNLFLASPFMHQRTELTLFAAALHWEITSSLFSYLYAICKDFIPPSRFLLEILSNISPRTVPRGI